MNKEDVALGDLPVSSEQLGQLINRVDDGTLSGKLGKQVFDALWSGEKDVDAIIEAKGLKQITDTGAIEAMIDEVIADNPSQLAEYRAGKEKLLSFFVGAVMKASRGKANPAQLNQMLRDKLKS
jgi:aspartyl-tRNA(Asn)/glutamyl-tRNA(Gln) amidotransferase subunit B